MAYTGNRLWVKAMAGMENNHLEGCIRTQEFAECRDSLDFLVNIQILGHLVFHFLRQGSLGYNLEMVYYHQIRNPHSHALKNYHVVYIQSEQKVLLYSICNTVTSNLYQLKYFLKHKVPGLGVFVIVGSQAPVLPGVLEPSSPAP